MDITHLLGNQSQHILREAFKNLKGARGLMRPLIRITKDSKIPLLGCIAFGIIDRGSDLVQVRATTRCNLSCIFCSTDAGSTSLYHGTDFEVDPGYLAEWLHEVLRLKGIPLEVNLDSVGEPTAYPHLIELVKAIAQLENVKRISMQTNGTLLSERLIDELADAGLSQLNISINSYQLQKDETWMRGSESYNLQKVIDMARYASSKKLDLLIAPLWMPTLNDAEMPKLIQLAKDLKAQIGIQKYETYRFSRKAPGVKAMNWWRFYAQLKDWEKKFGIPLLIDRQKYRRASRIPEVFRPREKAHVTIRAPGWFTGQMLGVAKDRCISVERCTADIGDIVPVRITETKNGLYLAQRL